MANIDSKSDPGAPVTAERQPYVAPQMIVIGNARDLLAGGEGTIDDGLGIPDSSMQLSTG
jgi:hypothetical protein